MQDFDIQQLDKQILGLFKNPAAAEKHNRLIEQKENLLKNQSSNEVQILECEIDEVKTRQLNSGERRNELLKTIQEKAEIVRIIQPKLETAQAELNQANFDLSIFNNNIQNDRITLKTSIAELNRLTGGKNDE